MAILHGNNERFDIFIRLNDTEGTTMENAKEGGQTPEKIVVPQNITVKEFTEKHLPLDLLESRILDYFEKNKDGEGDRAIKDIVMDMELHKDRILFDFLKNYLAL